MKRLFEDKRGMTLTELLVALTLLMIVIVGTTPVMLSAYSSLYTAGEKTQESYNAKSEIEDTLATRNSLNVVENFKVNFQGLGEVASINGKRAVSSLENSLETIFAGGRAHVAIVSSKVINDDKKSHDVILQTTNVTFKSPLDISYNTPDSVKVGGKAVDVSLYLPDKSSNALASIYAVRANTAEKGVVVTNANPATGRIYIDVNGVDFTNSPAKIEITYLDENDKVKRTSCYLTIKTPTIMAVGSTTYGDYYTTAGVETFKNPDGSTYDKLIVDARRMDIQGTIAGYTKQIPGGTVFRSVNWITEQTATTGEFVASSYEPSYYVLTGTNGAIYRTYSFKEYNTSFIGKTNLSISSNDTAAFTQKYHPVISQAGQDVLGIADSIYTLDDAQSTVVYPAVWGGDFSHIFGLSAYGEEAGYTNRTDPDRSALTWYTEDVNNNGKGQAPYYSNLANYCYYYNGWALDTEYHSMNSRKISYVLTEVPYAMRVGAFMGDVGSVDNYGYDGTTYDRIWEQPNADDGSHLNELTSLKKKFRQSILYSYTECWYYGAPGSSMPRSTIIRSNNDKDGDINKNAIYTLPVYFVNHNPHSDSGKRKDNGFAQLRLKALTTISPTIVQERGGHTDSSSDMRVAYNTTANQSKVIVTDAVYIPQTSTTQGGVFYVGTVAAYGWITQVDNCGTNDSSPDVQGTKNNSTSNTGWPTFYWVKSDDKGTNTTIFKTTIHSDSADVAWDDYRNLLIKNASLSDTTSIKANTTASHSFFVSQPAQGTVSGKLFSDVYFTMGFTSNREMVYTNIVYGRDSSTGKLTQSLKFCEPYYFQSHYDDADKVPSLYMNYVTDTNGETAAYLNTSENDYYNVWFPGEMYNLTNVATKDGVTVSVGYAVSGSSYSFLNTAQNGSTALGGIFNDGVLAAMVLGKDSAFTNLLYYKDNATFDGTSLSDGSVTNIGASGTNYKGMLNIDYGTHTRDSVQFTAVDISIEYTKSGNTENATYYAYYADNKGRLYKSKIATKATTLGGSSSTPQLVSHIADEPYDGTRSAPSYMEQVMVNGQPVGNYFSKITTVSCEGNYIIVGGHSKDSNFNLVIGTIQQSADQLSNTVTWKLGKIAGAAPYQLEDALILDGYIYLAGVSVTNPNLHRGFMCALSLEETNKMTDGNLPYNPNLFVGDENLQDRLYSIDGHKS